MQFEAKMNMGGLPGKGPFVAVFGQSNEGDVSPNTRYLPIPSFSDRSKQQIEEGFVLMELPALTTRVLAVVGLRVARQSVRTSFSLILFVFLILGPGKDMFDSTRIIGQNQFDFAYNLFNTAKVKLAAGNTSAVHAFVDFFNVTVSPKYSGLGVSASTCPAAIGDAYFNPFSSLFTNRVSTAAGTIDGAGDFDFHQVSFSHS